MIKNCKLERSLKSAQYRKTARVSLLARWKDLAVRLAPDWVKDVPVPEGENVVELDVVTLEVVDDTVVTEVVLL